jgi:hypothetical protein
MKHTRLTKLAIAGSTVACAALLSLSWSEQRGISLSVESAQARVGRPLTPVSVAGVARRQNRRAGYGYGYGAVGAGVAGAAAVAATSPSWGWGRDPYYTGTGYYTSGASEANAYYAPSTAGPSGWYITPSGMACTSGTWVMGADGFPLQCP